MRTLSNALASMNGPERGTHGRHLQSVSFGIWDNAHRLIWRCCTSFQQWPRARSRSPRAEPLLQRVKASELHPRPRWGLFPLRRAFVSAYFRLDFGRRHEGKELRYRYCDASGLVQPNSQRDFRRRLHGCCHAPHSHSIVPGGLLVTSYTTRFTPLTSLMMRVATRPRKAMSKG